MKLYRPPSEWIVYEDEQWIINHRVHCPVPGYLMLGVKEQQKSLGSISDEALKQLGPLLSTIERNLLSIFSPEHVYIGKLGHDSQFPLHFHIIPVHQWIIDAYQAMPDYFEAEPKPDAGNIILFIWREYCEGDLLPPSGTPAVIPTVETLRAAMG